MSRNVRLSVFLQQRRNDFAVAKNVSKADGLFKPRILNKKTSEAKASKVLVARVSLLTEEQVPIAIGTNLYPS